MSPDVPYEPAWQLEALALLHSLWQGLVIAVMLAAVLWTLRVRQARARYTLSLLALLAMAACPVVTLVVLTAAPSSVPSAVSTVEQAPAAASDPVSQRVLVGPAVRRDRRDEDRVVQHVRSLCA